MLSTKRFQYTNVVQTSQQIGILQLYNGCVDSASKGGTSCVKYSRRQVDVAYKLHYFDTYNIAWRRQKN